MDKFEKLIQELTASKNKCAELQEKCDKHQSQMFVANARRIKAEKEVAKLRMELALLKEGILV